MLKKGISVFILTKNCEETVRKTLESVRWADEIIIVDGFSTDKTLEICKRYKAKIFQRKFEGFDKERNFGIAQCKYPWIFEIDADEYLTEELEQDIQDIVAHDADGDYFTIKRKDYYLRRHLTTLKLIRLYRQGVARYENPTHEQIIVKGRKGRCLNGHAEHMATDTDSIFDDLRKIEHETEKEVLNRFKNEDMGKLSLLVNMIVRPVVLFFAWYVYKGFFRSGIPGLIFCLYNSFIYEFLIYVKYYEKKYIRGNTKINKMVLQNHYARENKK
ncbi:MAG: glycosyltransferase family 2 protein [archaeon]